LEQKAEWKWRKSRKRDMKLRIVDFPGFAETCHLFKNLKFPLKLLSSLTRSRRIIKKQKPDVAIGTGGYAECAVTKVASMRKVP
jgi:UDP-N-acetylglucosamine:LPS N-acetylglucosamine transferase